MKKILASAVMVTSFVTGVCFAGDKSVPYSAVNVSKNDNGSGYAAGVLGNTRNSADSVQYIQCTVSGQAGSNTQYVSCSAKNTAGVTLSCGSSDNNITTMARNISGDSVVLFTVDPAGACSLLYVVNGSLSAPKSPF
jgi:hypothetical protein